MYKAISMATLVCLSAQLFAQSSDNVTLNASLRSFGGDEGLEYLNVAAERSIAQDFKAQILADFSRQGIFTGSTFLIKHGGSDIEFLGTYAPKGKPYEFGLGLGVPNTPERSEGLMTYRAAYKVLNEGADRLSVQSFGVATPNPLFIIGAEDTYKMGHIEFTAFGGGPISGTNTVSTNTGFQEKAVLYSIGVNYYLSHQELSSVRVAITNQLGWTTGMAATASLGGTPGIEAEFKVRF
jgi:hypothetical protein